MSNLGVNLVVEAEVYLVSYCKDLDYICSGPLSTVAIEGQALLGALDSQNNATQPAYMVQLYSSLLGTGMTRDSVLQTRLRLNMEYKVSV